MGVMQLDPDKFTAALMASGMTAQALSERSGCSAAGISRYQGGKETPTARTVFKLAKALGVKPESLCAADKTEASPLLSLIRERVAELTPREQAQVLERLEAVLEARQQAGQARQGEAARPEK